MGRRERNIFYTSDEHFGHPNSIVFDERPFKSIDDMNAGLIRRHNSTVREQDIVYHGGDFNMGSAEFGREILSQLNGTHIMVLGNHDRGEQAMYNMGFDVVMHGATFVICGELVTMTHCPKRGLFREDVTGMRGVVDGDNWHGEHKHHKFSVQDYGQFHLHGHIHSGKHNDKLKIDGKQFDIGVVANNYAPVSISAIESWITRYK